MFKKKSFFILMDINSFDFSDAQSDICYLEKIDLIAYFKIVHDILHAWRGIS